MMWLYFRNFVFLMALVVVSHGVAVAQSEQVDSLLSLLPTTPDDTSKTYLYENIGLEYQYSGNTDKAMEYYQKQIALSEKLNYLTGVWRGTVGCCDLMTWTGQYDSVLMLYENIAPRIEASGREDLMRKLNTNLGMAHDNKGHFEIAVDYFLKALNEFEKINDAEGVANVNALLQLTYMRLGFHDKAIAAGEQAVKVLKKINHPAYQRTLVNLGEVYMFAGNHEKAEEIFLELIKLTDEKPEMFARSLSLLDLGNIYFQKKDYRKAEKYALESLEIFTMADYTFGIVGAMHLLGQIEFQLKNFTKSENYTLKALEIAERDVMYTDIVRCLNLLADIDIVKGDYQAMFQKRQLSDSVNDIVINDRVRQASEELSIKYETEKKNLKIQLLEEEKYLSRVITIISVVVMVLLFIASVFIFLWTKQKRKQAEIKIKQLEQEKQLVATQALLDGETQERTRLARDLHDGLGSILAATKYNLADIKKTPMELINVSLLDKALALLDESMHEMRRVAHHLMPESLTRCGLKQSIADFCQSIPIAKFAYYGNEMRLDPKLNVMVYRIIHELVSNAIKHSGASQIFVQIFQETDRIAFSVEDNGCGFDTTAASNGTGVSNIRTRVAAYNGILLIDSKPNVGTEVSVELKV